MIAAGDRFLVDVGNERRHAYRLVDRRGRIEKVNRSPSVRPIAPGDVLIPPRFTNDEWATIVRPDTGTAFKVNTPGTVRLYLATDGALWGESAGFEDLEVRWRRDDSSFMSYTFDRVADYEPTYGPRPGGVVASGPHAAAVSCSETSEQTCGLKLAVTSDGGRSWTVREFDSLPFKNISSYSGLAVAGTTLIVAELRFGGSGPRTVLWRSTDRAWTRFERLASPRACTPDSAPRAKQCGPTDCQPTATLTGISGPCSASTSPEQSTKSRPDDSYQITVGFPAHLAKGN